MEADLFGTVLEAQRQSSTAACRYKLVSVNFLLIIFSGDGVWEFYGIDSIFQFKHS